MSNKFWITTLMSLTAGVLFTSVQAVDLPTSEQAVEAMTEAASDSISGAASTTGDLAEAAGEATATDSADTSAFSQLDIDANGAISLDEAQNDQELMLIWSNADTNQDGQLDEVEFSALEIDESAPAE